MIEKELIIHYEPKRISIIAETEEEVNERVALEVRKTRWAIESVELVDVEE